MPTELFKQKNKITTVANLRKDTSAEEFFDELLKWLKIERDDYREKLEQVTDYYKQQTYEVYHAEMDALRVYIEAEADKQSLARAEQKEQEALAHGEKVRLFTDIQIAIVGAKPAKPDKSKKCLIS